MAEGYNQKKAAARALLTNLERVKDYLDEFIFAVKDFDNAVLDESKMQKFPEIGKRFEEYIAVNRQVIQSTLNLEKVNKE